MPHQWQFFSWDDDARLTVEAILGGYGSGKTIAAARKFAFRVCQLKYSNDYGTARPQAVAMAPTSRILKRVTEPILEQIIPRELIIKKRLQPHIWTLHNGTQISFVSGEASFEGESLACMWIDEIHHEIFSHNPERYINYIARIRDPLAPKLSMIVSGLPESGWVRETFDKTGPGLHTQLCGTQDNPHIPRETLSAIMASCPLGYEDAYIRGDWMCPPDAVFSQYVSTLHLSDTLGEPSRPVHIGIDVGNHGAVIFAQTRTVSCKQLDGKITRETGVLIVDQIITHDESVAGMCEAIKFQRKWLLDPNTSTICVDPTIRRDEMQAIREHFPRIKIVKRDKDHELYPIEAGIRIIQTGLRDAHGNVRLQFSRPIAWQKFGVIEAIQTARRHQISQRVIKDDSRDHALDALRYVTQELLRPSAPRLQLLGPR